MAATSNATVLELFKEVYGDMVDYKPTDQKLSKLIPFSTKAKVGEQYVTAVSLTFETGFTLSSSTDAFELNAPRAGVVKQTTVVPYITVLPSIIPWAVVSRSAGGGAKAFYEATKFVTRNNLRSHEKLQEILRWYGQAPALLGYVSYATATYRNVSFTNGTGILNGITFTNGVNTTTKNILFAPGSFAAGIWVGMENVRVNQVNASNAIVASGSLVSVNVTYGYITVDFVPVAASSTTSHRLCFEGMEAARDVVGINNILTTTGTLFGINTQAYSLWKAINYPVNGKFTLAKYNMAVADLVNLTGLEGDLTVFLNPRSWATVANTEAGLRVYDESYKPSGADRIRERHVLHAGW